MNRSKENTADIVLLEDNRDFADAIKRFLDDHPDRKYNIANFSNVDSAVKALRRKESVHLFIVDLKLASEKSGYDFLRIVQEENMFPDTPRMVISDLSRDRVSLSGQPVPEEELMRVGMSSYLEKRFFWENGPRQFVEAVDSLIDARVETTGQALTFNRGLFAFSSGVYLGLFGMVLALFSVVIGEHVVMLVGLAAFAVASVFVTVPVQSKPGSVPT